MTDTPNIVHRAAALLAVALLAGCGGQQPDENAERATTAAEEAAEISKAAARGELSCSEARQRAEDALEAAAEAVDESLNVAADAEAEAAEAVYGDSDDLPHIYYLGIEIDSGGLWLSYAGQQAIRAASQDAPGIDGVDLAAHYDYHYAHDADYAAAVDTWADAHEAAAAWWEADYTGTRADTGTAAAAAYFEAQAASLAANHAEHEAWLAAEGEGYTGVIAADDPYWAARDAAAEAQAAYDEARRAYYAEREATEATLEAAWAPVVAAHAAHHAAGGGEAAFEAAHAPAAAFADLEAAAAAAEADYAAARDAYDAAEVDAASAIRHACG